MCVTTAVRGGFSTKRITALAFGSSYKIHCFVKKAFSYRCRNIFSDLIYFELSKIRASGKTLIPNPSLAPKSSQDHTVRQICRTISPGRKEEAFWVGSLWREPHPQPPPLGELCGQNNLYAQAWTLCLRIKPELLIKRPRFVLWD